jgi:hypothetical protein
MLGDDLRGHGEPAFIVQCEASVELRKEAIALVPILFMQTLQTNDESIQQESSEIQ